MAITSKSASSSISTSGNVATGYGNGSCVGGTIASITVNFSTGTSSASGAKGASGSWGPVNTTTSYNTYVTTQCVVRWSDGTTTTGSAVGAYTDAAPPGSPSGMYASDGGAGAINISWGGASGATGYNIYKDGAYRGSVSGTSWTDTGLAEGSYHSYYVTAYTTGINGKAIAGGSSGSAGANAGYSPPAAPAAPTGTTASTNGPGGIYVSWNAVANASGYYITRFNPGGGTTQFYSGSTAYSDTGLSEGAQYSYYVQAYTSGPGGTSYGPNGTQVYANAGYYPPAAPGNVASVTASTGTAPGQINVSWSAASGASGYYLYRDGGYLTTLGATSYTDSGLVPGSSHSYSVTPYASGAGGTTGGNNTASNAANAMVAGFTSCGILQA